MSKEKIRKRVLNNGLTVLEVQVPSARSVLVDVFVKVGSRNEVPRVNGISHFLEHLFFKGSAKYPTAMKLSHALDAIGSEYNAETGKEHTQYYIKAAKKHFRFIFETLADVIKNPVFAPEEVEREKGVIIEEINMYRDTPIRHVEDLFEEAMWRNQALGRNIAGTKEIIRRASREDVVGYKESFYQPQNMILAVSGAYDSTVLDKLVEKHWAGLRGQKVPKFERAQDNSRQTIMLEPKKLEQYHLVVGFPSYDYDDKFNIPQMVLSGILGGGMSSRLFTEIRERRGLAYYVKSGVSNYQDTGNFYIKAGLRLKATQDAVRLIASELRRLKNKSVGAAEFDKTKEYLKGNLILALEHPESMLGWYLEQVAFKKKVQTPEEIFSLIDKVRPQDVQRVARDLFRNDRMVITGIGPKQDERKLRALSKI